jgi:hypothetical protein
LSSLPVNTKQARETLAQRLQRQASWCDDLGSPFYASLLVFMQYVDVDGRRRIASAIESGAAHATRDGPLAYLRMEPGAQTFEVRLTLWPGGGDELLALTRAHGTGVRWL